MGVCQRTTQKIIHTFCEILAETAFPGKKAGRNIEDETSVDRKVLDSAMTSEKRLKNYTHI